MEGRGASNDVQGLKTPRPSSTPWGRGISTHDGAEDHDSGWGSEEDEAQCFACKVTGTLSMVGLGTYALYERSKLKVNDRRGRLFIGAFSALLYGLGAYRATID